MVDLEWVESQINNCFERHRWSDARKILESANKEHPGSHWILTQIAVTYYEQKQYDVALGYLKQSYSIKPDCPLTIWNLAGTWDALGSPFEALSAYYYLIHDNRTSTEDPCWESNDWEYSLKADCMYRAGQCFEHLDQNVAAVSSFWQYLQMTAAGCKGMYDVKDAWEKVYKLQKKKKFTYVGNNFYHSFDSHSKRAIINLVSAKDWYPVFVSFHDLTSGHQPEFDEFMRSPNHKLPADSLQLAMNKKVLGFKTTISHDD